MKYAKRYFLMFLMLTLSDIYVRYTIGDMRFIFHINPGMSFITYESIEGIRVNEVAQWSRLTTVGDVNIYVHRMIDQNDNPDFPEQPEDPQVIFILSVNGMYVGVSVSIDCVNPGACVNGWDFGSGHSCNGEWVDRQAAIDGILQFEFKALF